MGRGFSACPCGRKGYPDRWEAAVHGDSGKCTVWRQKRAAQSSSCAEGQKGKCTGVLFIFFPSSVTHAHCKLHYRRSRAQQLKFPCAALQPALAHPTAHRSLPHTAPAMSAPAPTWSGRLPRRQNPKAALPPSPPPGRPASPEPLIF